MKKNIIGYSLVAMSIVPVIGKSQDRHPNILLLITDEHSGRVMTQTGYPY